MGEAVQLFLIAGYYRCHSCGRDVEQTKKERRWHLCPDCHEELTAPDKDGRYTTFWEWREQMEEMYPLGGRLRWRVGDSIPIELSRQAILARRLQYPDGWAKEMERAIASNPLDVFTTDSYYPLCECGRERPEYEDTNISSLFGKRRARECNVCRSKREIRATDRNSSALHPDWDDEDWLDLLYKSHPEAFEVGVLPDYWYELRRGQHPA